MKVTLTVVRPGRADGLERFVFEASAPDGLSLTDVRRLLQAEQTINTLTTLRVHIDQAETDPAETEEARRGGG